MTTPMNQKEKFCKDDGAEKVDEARLMYLTETRPNILFAVSVLSRFMHCASELHLKAAKRIIRYILKELSVYLAIQIVIVQVHSIT